ncbi:hypothetical protein ACP179_01890 (plasmid) [Xenorhabdus stockiae]|uniref:hypothetical protein n=1 Tax=Xenorhabdus stockiae TaxID=351614 RepID=UPI003CEACBA4
MSITLTTSAHHSFEIIKATDVSFLLKETNSELFFELFHGYVWDSQKSSYPCHFHNGQPVCSLGMFSRHQLDEAWDQILGSVPVGGEMTR